MKLSIITINYNNISGLRNTIASVLYQTWRDFEWIIIDGGSTDGSKELIKETASHPNSNISFWCSEPDKGIYNAMNKGILKAHGDYLHFLNSADIYCSNNTLEIIAHDLCNYDIIYGNIIIGDAHLRIPSKLSLGYLISWTIPHQSSFIKRSSIVDYLYDESFKIVSDWKFFIESYLRNATFRHIHQTVSIFDMNGTSSNNNLLIEREKHIVLTNIFGPKAHKLWYEIMRTNEIFEGQYSDEIELTIKFLKHRPRRSRLFSIIITFLLKIVK